MSPTPPSTNSSTGHSPAADYRVVRKRNRVPLSCGPCRARKLKCNRTAPCENCIRRGDAQGCSYAAPVGPRKRSTANSSSTSNSAGDDMQSRIDRLEDMVLSLMTNGAQAPGLAAASKALGRTESNAADVEHDEDTDEMIKEEDEEDDDGISEEGPYVKGLGKMFGAMKVNKEKEGMYIGDSHWHLVLADIKEVRNFWNSHQSQIQNKYCEIEAADTDPNKSTALLYPNYPRASDAELRNALPPRPQIESLVARFFGTHNPVGQVLHPPTFMSQIQIFFRNPSSHTTAWIALLYSVLTIAMQSYTAGVDEPVDWAGRTKDMAQMYRQRTVQALVVGDGDYSIVRPHTLEAILLYLHGELHRRGECDVSLWLVVGNAVRLALRAGYHRDAEQFGELDAFTCEMRRRVWLYLRQIDILSSSSLALPSMIKPRDCDTKLPLNLFDESFGPNSKALPTPQPDEVITPMSYLRAKGRISLLLSEIIDETQGLSAPKTNYTTILNFDAQLRNAAEAIPQQFRVKPIEESINDPQDLILLRYHIEIMANKVACVLHRRYVNLGNKVKRYELSRIRGVNAAMRLLQLQDMIKRDTGPGGRRFVGTKGGLGGMQRGDFVLGAMVVCLDMAFLPRKGSQDSGAMSTTSESPVPSLPGSEELKYNRCEMMEALLGCMRILETESSESIDAYKALSVLKVMVEKLKKRDDHCKLEQQKAFEKTFADPGQDEGPEHSAAVTLGMLSAGLSPNTAALFNSGSGTGMTPGRENMQMGGYDSGFMADEGMSPFSQMFATANNSAAGPLDVPDNLDWMAWDRYLQPDTGVGAMDTDAYLPSGFSPPPPQSTTMQPPQQPDMGYGYGYNPYMVNNTAGSQFDNKG